MRSEYRSERLTQHWEYLKTIHGKRPQEFLAQIPPGWAIDGKMPSDLKEHINARIYPVKAFGGI